MVIRTRHPAQGLGACCHVAPFPFRPWTRSVPGPSYDEAQAYVTASLGSHTTRLPSTSVTPFGTQSVHGPNVEVRTAVGKVEAFVPRLGDDLCENELHLRIPCNATDVDEGVPLFQ